jgi:hypothetical protein
MQVLAVRVNESDIPDLIGLFVGTKGDPAAIGRPVGLGRVAVPGCDPAKTRPVDANDEDRVLVLVRVVPLEGETLPVRRLRRRVILEAELIGRRSELGHLL